MRGRDREREREKEKETGERKRERGGDTERCALSGMQSQQSPPPVYVVKENVSAACTGGKLQQEPVTSDHAQARLYPKKEIGQIL